MSSNAFPIKEFFNRTVVFNNPALSPDGCQLAYISSISGSPQIWIGPIDKLTGKLGYPKPLTSDTRKRPYVFMPSLVWINENQIACMFDTDGDEQTFIEIFNLKTGEVTAVPRPADTSSRDILYFASNKGKRGTLYFTSNREVPEAQGLYTFDLQSNKVTAVYQNKKNSSSWCENIRVGSYQVFELSLSTNKNTLMGVDLKTGKTQTYFDQPQVIATAIAALKKGLLVATDLNNEFWYLGLLRPQNGSIEKLTAAKWDQYPVLSPNKKNLLIEENVAGRSVLHFYSWPSLKKRPFKFHTNGVVDHKSFSKDGRYLLLAFASPTEPRNYYRVDLKTLKVQRLTDNYTSKVPQRELIHPKFVTFRSQDRSVHSMFFLPKGAKKTRSIPVIVWPHGGPQFQERPQQRPIFQFFLSRGFAIWAPNHTGSTGFGKSFMRDIQRAWGTADLPDMKNGVEWLKATGYIDPKKIVIMGGSYGGYMTLRSITQMADVFKVAVDVFGPSNLISFAKSVPPDWMPYMDNLVGNPVKDKAMLESQSPLLELERIMCPLLVIQGARDPRVVQAESDQLVAAMRKRGQKVEYLVFEDEGHGFLKLENELTAYTKIADFISLHI